MTERPDAPWEPALTRRPSGEFLDKLIAWRVALLHVQATRAACEFSRMQDEIADEAAARLAAFLGR